MRKMIRRRVVLDHVGRLQNPSGRERILAVGVGVDALCALWSTAEIADFFGRELRIPDDRRPLIRSGDVVAVTYQFGSTEPRSVTPLKAMPVEPDFVQPLSDGRVLVVASRCEWRPDGADLNAAVFGLDGVASRRGCLGDDISHLQVSKQGTIWAGYGDEGVFGNLGWGSTYYDEEDLRSDRPPVFRSTEEPLGAAGLVQWSLDFQRISECSHIYYWCEALNVGPDDVCIWPDSEPFMLRISDSGEERLDGRPTRENLGFAAGVINHPHVAVIGSSRKSGSITAGVVEHGEWRETWRGELRLPEGARLPEGTRIEARGSTAHLFVDNDWYQFELDVDSGPGNSREPT